MICIYEECNNEFEPKTHNQKYCSDECCRIATNKKVKEDYYEKKARRSGVVFKCKTKGCDSTLSRYSAGNICNGCIAKEKERERKRLIQMLKDVGI
jgi:hypothetical protein